MGRNGTWFQEIKGQSRMGRWGRWEGELPGVGVQLFLGFQNWKGDKQHHSPDDSPRVLTEGRIMYPALWSLPASQSWFQ